MILDGLACNEHGYPLDAEYGLLAQGFDFQTPFGLPAQSVSGGQTTWSFIADRAAAYIAAAPRRPDFVLWWNNGGPTYFDSRINGRLYCADAMLHARDGAPAWASDSADRSGLWSTLPLLVQAALPAPSILYVGNFLYADFLAYGATTGRARLDDVLGRVKEAGFRGIQFDLSAPVGGHSRPADASSDTHWLAQWWADNSRRWQSDASWPVFLVEAWPEASLLNGQRPANRLSGPLGAERVGLPAGGLWIQPDGSRAGAINDALVASSNSEIYSPANKHRGVWFAADYGAGLGATTWRDNPAAPGRNGPALAREWITKTAGAVAIGEAHWGGLSALLPPRRTRASFLPSGRPLATRPFTPPTRGRFGSAT